MVPLIWTSMNPGAMRAPPQSYLTSAQVLSSKKIGSGLIIFLELTIDQLKKGIDKIIRNVCSYPLRVQMSSCRIFPLRRMKQLWN